MSKPTLTQIHHVSDETLAAFEAMARVWSAQAVYAPQIATARYKLFRAYVEAGFNEAQAIELCKSLSL